MPTALSLKRREQKAAYYIANKECIKAQRVSYRTANADKVKARESERLATTAPLRKIVRDKLYLLKAKDRCEYNRVYRDKIKLEVFTTYCSGSLKCAQCSENRLGALHIDHIENDGKYQDLKHRGGHKLYLYLRRNKYPVGYQILCSNCNWRKHMANLQLGNSYSAVANRKLRIDIKTKFMSKLGGQCENCTCCDLSVLTVDHIDYNGAEHRRALKSLGSTTFYKAILKSNNFSGLRCYCFSCNDASEYDRTISADRKPLSRKNKSNPI